MGRTIDAPAMTEDLINDNERSGRPLLPEAIRLDDSQIQQAALLAGEEAPDMSWTRFLRGLSLIALKQWINHRKATIVVGPELSPEEPDRLLALNGLATQLLCVSPLADEVEVPLSPWQETATSPQMLLLSEVDEDNGVVHFPGVLDAKAFIGEVMRLKASKKEAVELPLELFQGGLERMLRWVNLLEKDALPRVGLGPSAVALEGFSAEMKSLRKWLDQLLNAPTLIPLPAVGTRGQRPVVQMITPEVEMLEGREAIAVAICPTPSIWAETPLAEILLEHDRKDGKVVWRRQANKDTPIEGPVPWPLEPLLPGQVITIKLRPHGAPGASQATLTLEAPDAAQMRLGDELIQQAIQQSMLATNLNSLIPKEDKAVGREVAARLWLLRGK